MDRSQQAIAESIGFGSSNIDYKTKVKTDVECPNCKQPTWKRIDMLLTSNPPKHQYECSNCGWIGWLTF